MAKKIVAKKKRKTYGFREALYLSESNRVRATSPRRAALKMARKGYIDIFLREWNTNKVHQYVGYREQIPTPEDRKKYVMKDMMWVPHVDRVCLLRIEGVSRRQPFGGLIEE